MGLTNGSTKGLTKVKIDVMNHYINGGEIEFISKTCPLGLDGWTTWAEDYEPLWDWVAFDYRIKKNPKFRLPTMEEFDNLIEHFSRWDKEKKGLEILNKKGDILFFPALGHRYGTSCRNKGTYGYYWSSIMYEHGKYSAYNLYFDSSSKYMIVNGILSEYSVRLVSDEPFEGAIEFNNVYWKPENEEGYFTHEVAINKFQ